MWIDPVKRGGEDRAGYIPRVGKWEKKKREEEEEEEGRGFC